MLKDYTAIELINELEKRLDEIQAYTKEQAKPLVEKRKQLVKDDKYNELRELENSREFLKLDSNYNESEKLKEGLFNYRHLFIFQDKDY